MFVYTIVTDMLSVQRQEAENKAMRASLRSDVKLEGIGIHSGKKVRLKIQAAPAKSGIVFRHSRKAKGTIQLSPNCVVSTLNAVTISNGKWQVRTVEHLLAAMSTAGINDAIIEIDANEAPIMDGSAIPFYAALMSAGRQESAVELSPIRLSTAVWVVDGDRYLIALPPGLFKRYLRH